MHYIKDRNTSITPEMKQVIIALGILTGLTEAFWLQPAKQSSRSHCSKLFAEEPSSSSVCDSSSRQGFLQTLAGQAALVGFGMTAGPLLVGGKAGVVQPAQAAGLSKVNGELASYGLPPILDVPGGFSPLVEVYGKAAGAKKERETLLVQFLYPSLWVVSKPSIDKNGEEGTISAGDYQKGDSAAFYVEEGPASGKLEQESADYFGEVVTRAIGQKSQNVYQNFKVLKKRPGAKGANGAQYTIVEFKYELLTGAGFTVDRKGVASVTQVGKNVQGLWVATTAARWKKIGNDCITMADSFRVYDGIAPA